MENTTLAGHIYNAAIQQGYSNCGIIPLAEMDGYIDKLHERITRVPESGDFYRKYTKFANPELASNYPWAKAIVVCTSWYGKFVVPEKLKGYFGKRYLMDGRVDTQSAEWQTRWRFEKELEGFGIQYYGEPKFGITGVRYAAMQAGLGIMRKNNLFYTEKGSYVTMTAWLIDKEIELRHKCNIKPCAESCNLCQTACKTGSLSAPYTMNPLRCISYITTNGKGILPDGVTEHDMGKWVYGCDDCQDACPHNKKAWTNDYDFPGLNELESLLVPDALAIADDETLEAKVQPKLWYIPPDRLAQYRENAVRALRVEEKPKP